MSIDFDKYKITDPERIKQLHSQNVNNDDLDQYKISDLEKIRKLEEKNNKPEKSFWEHYQDFMSPTESQGQSTETLFGRLPKEMPQFKSGTKENKDLIEDMINNAASMPGIKSAVEIPFKLSLKNIAKKLVGEKNAQRLYHNNEYDKLWKAAEDAGISKVKLNPDEINIEALKAGGANKKYIKPLENLMENPTLKNAQTAQSDLGKLINSPQLSKEVLTSEENAVKNFAEKAQKHIRDMMFRNENGEINQSLKDMYNKVTSSYEKNMIPYKNPAITKYERGKLTPKQLLQKIKSGEFMAQKGSAHPEINRREHALDALKYLGIPTGIGLGLEGGKYLMDQLLGK